MTPPCHAAFFIGFGNHRLGRWRNPVKKDLASSFERSELITIRPAVTQRILTEDRLPVYGRRGMKCRRKVVDAS